MERAAENTLRVYLDDLYQESPDAREIIELLKRAGLSLTRAEPLDLPRSVAKKSRPAGTTPRTWLLYGNPDKPLRQRFDLAPELLVVLMPSHTAQARDITRAEQALLRDHRLDRGLVVVIARDDNAASTLEHPARSTGRVYAFRSYDALFNVRDPQTWLRRLLRKELGASDLFANAAPVFGWDFTGRKEQIQALRKHLRRGRPVALYGLRKVGKTSLILVMRQQLIADSRSAREGQQPNATPRIDIPIHVDAQEIDFAECNRAGFMRALIFACYQTLKELDIEPTSLDLKPRLGSFAYLSTLSPERVEREGTLLLKLLGQWASEAPGQRCVMLLIDEYERLLNDDVFPRRDGLDIFDFLRGLVQTHRGSVNFLFAGLSRRLADASRFGDRQNPLFNFAIDFPLAGLTLEEMGALFRKIGRRLSLAFKPEALAVIWEDTGGHPFLAREMGRLLDQNIAQDQRSKKVEILAATVRDRRKEFQIEVANTMQEIAHAASQLDPEAPFALSYLQAASSKADADEALALLRDEVVTELERLGIVARDAADGRWLIRIGCFARWLGANWDTTSAMASA